jgi:hypothetical protein
VTLNEEVGQDDEPLDVIELGGRHPWPGGLYLLAIELHREGVVLRLYTSRPTPSAELVRRLRLLDKTPTTFVCDPPETEIVDGRGVLFFRPAPESGLKGIRVDDTNGGRALLSFN